MLNKKILATAVAVAFSSNAFAVVDLKTNANDSVRVASEALVASDFNGDGFVEMLNNVDPTADPIVPFASDGLANSYLDVETVMGFTVGQGTSKYLRLNLTGGEFGETPTVTIRGPYNGVPPVVGAVITTAILSQGGKDSSFAVFEVPAPANEDIPANAVVVIEGESYLVNPTGSSSISVATFDDAGDAVNQTNPLFSDSETFTVVTDVVTGDFTDSLTSIATVGSNFLQFDFGPGNGDAIDVDTARVGSLDSADYLGNVTSVDNDGTEVEVGDVLTALQSISVTGDFSFGEKWYLGSGNNCTEEVTLTVNSDKTAAVSGEFDITAQKLDVCVDVFASNSPQATTIKKGTYAIELLDDNLENAIGGIVYNTVSIDVPYITTFSQYNQRLYIVNNGNQDALYTMVFTSEDGTTTSPLAGSTGTVPAGEMVALKATDVVAISGDTTRTSAVLEIEAEDGDVSVATQSVNTETGGTDTSVLK